jgi:hypothetical protein
MTRLGPTPRNAWDVSANAADLVRAPVPPRPVRFAAEPKPVALDLARTAIIVVDMQNDFCHQDGWLAGIGVDVARARRLRPWCACCRCCAARACRWCG